MAGIFFQSVPAELAGILQSRFQIPPQGEPLLTRRARQREAQSRQTGVYGLERLAGGVDTSGHQHLR